tara:strand:- start:157 stop:1281 length:1125 start_codon:yes stop_codon:yes gene_type:complete
MQTALAMAATTLVIALVFGLMPIKGSPFNDQKRLKTITAIASGIIIASALLVVIPEGFELATGEDHDEHGDDAIGGDVAIVLLEHDAGEIDAETAIEEIEDLFGDHEGHDDEEGHSEEGHSESEGEEESLSEEIMHVIEEVEDGDIDAATGLAEIETLVLEHGHEEEEHEETPGAVYGLAILLGFLLMLLLEASGAGHAIHEEHHDHAEEHGHEHIHHHKMGRTLVTGLSLHAAADGLAIGAAIASGESALTTAVVAAVLIHKAPAAFSLGVFSMHERGNESQSIKDVALFSAATPLALIVSYLAISDIESATLGLIMLFSAGSFLYVATVDTLPDIHNPETGRSTVVPMLMGIALVGILLLLASQMGWLEHGH